MDEQRIVIVEDALRAFITKEISRALGAEYLDVYSPAPGADTIDLVRYIIDKWLGIFADSNTVANQRTFFNDVLKSLKKDPRDVDLNTRILVEIGAPGKAAALTKTNSRKKASTRNAYANGNSKSDANAGRYGASSVDANAYGGTPGPSSRTSNSTISKTSTFNGGSTSNVDADGDMTMGGDEGRTNFSSSTITTHSSSGSSSARKPFPPSMTSLSNDIGNGNGNGNIDNNDSAMVDVEIDSGYSGGTDSKIVVVLDGANIGWRFGRTKFSMIGVASAVAHYQCLNCRVVLVLPDGLCNPDSDSKTGRNREENEAVKWVNSLKDTAELIVTPDSDYDDAYVTHLARRLSAIIVSNDQFKDQIYQAAADTKNKNAENEWRTYLAKCRCSFAFLGKRFVPNPAFDIERGAAIARKYSLSPD